MIKKIKTELVNTLPYKEEMEEDTIYISERSWNATHLDFKGSGEEIMTPFLRGGFGYNLDDDNEITIFPEIVTSQNEVYLIKNGYAYSA